MTLRYLLTTATALSLLMPLPSCHKWDNGDLDGFWQLAEVDTLATGGHHYMATDQIFWAFQGSLVQMEQTGEAYPYIFVFDRTDDQLSLSKGVRNWRSEGDIVLQDSDLVHLAPMGVHSLNATYVIEKNDSRRLILDDGQFRLRFNRF